MILCCGEALIDMIQTRLDDGSTAFVPKPGGAVFNTSVALARLGEQSALFTGISTDAFGRLLTDALADSGVDTGYVLSSGAPSPLAFAWALEPPIHYSFHDQGSAARIISEDQLPTLDASVNALFFGGISLISEPAADSYMVLAEREAKDRVVLLDPNIRAGFVSDEPRYRARLARMMAVADIVKVSDEDLDWLCPGSEPAEDRLAGLLEGGAKLALLTLGADGALARTAKGEVIRVAARRTQVADTIGAGDTFNAGFICHLSRRGLLNKSSMGSLGVDDISAALDLGVRAAAVTVSRPGANPPWASELDGTS